MPNQRAAGVTPHTVAFPDDLWERVQQEAARERRSAGAVVREAVEVFLNVEHESENY